ncbi:hypothetical protein [Halomicrococcus sp. SG-WS-1]|uniref:hypothetical protein n=1 Tax=Halomicrococcus sp. SG-WS-1 TaxID=3439057 RepID=UPI003F79A969
MEDFRRRLYEWLADESTRTVILFVVAVLFGGGSLAMFLQGGTGSPTRLEFVLLVAAMFVVFYATLRSSSF